MSHFVLSVFEVLQVTVFQLQKSTLVFKCSVFRPNLFYDVVYKQLLADKYGNLKKFIETALGAPLADGVSEYGPKIFFFDLAPLLRLCGSKIAFDICKSKISNLM